MPEAVVELKAVPEKRLLSVRGIVPQGGSIPARFDEVMGGLKDFPHWDRMGHCVAYYYGEPGDDMEVEIGFMVPEAYDDGYIMGNGEVMSIHTAPAMTTAASVIHRGSYDGIGAAWNALVKWISESGYYISGPCCEVYLNDPDQVPPEEYLTELQVPVEKL